MPTGLHNQNETSLISLISLTAVDFFVLGINIEYVSDVQVEKIRPQPHHSLSNRNYVNPARNDNMTSSEAALRLRLGFEVSSQ